MAMDGLVSLIFFGIEFAMLIVIIIFNRDHPHFWSIVTLLALLQLYQLSEFLVCIGVSVGIITRLGYVIITFLPPTGYFLCTRVVKWKFPDYWLGFALALGFSIYYLVDTASVTLVSCNPFYASYIAADLVSGTLYGAYYYGILL